jgi:hypothetical protein
LLALPLCRWFEVKKLTSYFIILGARPRWFYSLVPYHTI